MDPSALRVPSSSSSLSPFYLTSIPSADSRISAAASSVPSVSIISPSSLASSSPSLSSSSSDFPASSLILLYIALPICLYPTAGVSSSMTSPRLAHSCRLSHAVFSWSPASLITSLARARQSVSPIPTGRTPCLLTSTTRRKSISAG